VKSSWFFFSTQFRKVSVQPGLRGSNDLRVGRKMATYQLFSQFGRAKDLSAPLYMCVCVLMFTTGRRERFVKLKNALYGGYASTSETYLWRLNCFSAAFSSFPETGSINFREIQKSSYPDPQLSPVYIST